MSAPGTETPSTAAALPTHFRLANGQNMPSFGLGTWQSKPGEVGSAVETALKSGYDHIDCAAIYQNEAEIGKVLTSQKYIPREKLFITSKLWNTHHRPDKVPIAIAKTLKDLELKQLDLYLMHWPIALKYLGEGQWFPKENDKVLHDDDVTIEETWIAMEKLVDEGKVKSIGLSNFNIPRLERILKIARIKPVVNQVELHPYLPQPELFEFCKKNDILLTAYSPFGSGMAPRILDDAVLAEVAKKNDKTVAQVLVSWAIQRGTVVIPKSVTPSRIEENKKYFVLSDEDMKAINALGARKLRYLKPVDFFQKEIFECP